MLPSLLAACLVLLAGGLLGQHVPLLTRYSIPAPIIGGLIFALIALLAERTTGLGITFDTSARGPFLLLFFAAIGLTADLAVLRQGGARLVRFLIALFPFLLVQDALGIEPWAIISGFWKFLKSQHLSLYIDKMFNSFLKPVWSEVIEPRECLFF